jgi:hypothetical protein
VQPINGAQYVIATMTDGSKAFTTNSMAGRTIVSGSNQAVVFSNSATVLTLKTPWSPATPVAGAAYTVTPQANTGAVGSNTATQLSLETGWTPTTPSPGAQYYVHITAAGGTVQSNGAQSITVASPWSPAIPTGGSKYSVTNTQPISPCGVAGFDTTVTFDPTKLQYLSATTGSWLTSTGRPIYPNPCTPTTTATTVTMSCITQGNTPLGPTGSGALFTIRFKPLGAVNTSTVVTQVTSLADTGADPVTHTDFGVTVQFDRCADVAVPSNGAVTIEDVDE